MLCQIRLLMLDMLFLLRLGAKAANMRSVCDCGASHCVLVEPKSVAGAVDGLVTSPCAPIAPVVPLAFAPAAAALARLAAPAC